MRDHDHHGSGQVGAEHADAGQTGHETGHGSLRGRLRRVLSDGLKGLAHGVLADEIDRLAAQRDQWCAEAKSRARRDGMKRAYVDGIMAELQAAVVERDTLQAEVERLRGQVERLNAEGPTTFRNRVLEVLSAPRDCTPETAVLAIRLMQRQRDEAWDEIEAWKSASGLERGGDPDAVTPADLAQHWLDMEHEAARLQKERNDAQADVERWKRVHDCQLAAKTRALQDAAELRVSLSAATRDLQLAEHEVGVLRAGLTGIADDRNHDHDVGHNPRRNVGACDGVGFCRKCTAADALERAAGPFDDLGVEEAEAEVRASRQRDPTPTGQKVVTSDGRLADVCFDGLVRLAKPPLVVIESPYAGDVEANVAYARAALLDSLRRGEAPLASHLLYTQVLDDQDPELRALGINAGFAWSRHADKVAVYQGRGISDGMRQGIALAESLGIEVEYREVVVDEPAPLPCSDETVQHDGRGVGYAPTIFPEQERSLIVEPGGARPKAKHFSDETVAQGRMPRHVGPGGAVYDVRADDGEGEG